MRHPVRSVRRLSHVVLIAGALWAAGHTATAQAQSVGIFPSQEAGKRVTQAREISPYGPDVMGDSFGMYSGGLSFAHTDAAIPGNSGLPVSVGRNFSADAGRMPLEHGERYTDTWLAYQGLFGDWQIDLPYLSGTYSQLQGWVVQTGSPTARCSSPASVGEMYPPALIHQQAYFRSHAIHSGVTLNLPGGGGEPLTLRMGASPHPKPNDSSYRWQTKSNWALSCLPMLQHSVNYTGSGSRGGEGFLAVAPDGTRYRFDWMVEYAEKQVKQLTWTQTTGAYGSYNASEAKLPRVEARIYPTRVEDRFGNWVNYTWSGKRLTAITASDGRSISLAYNAQNRISSITAAGVTTTYGYDGNGSLTSVTRADGSQWTFNFASLWTHPRYRLIQFNVEHYANWEERFMCAGGRLLNTAPVTLGMTSPSGASGSFQLHFRRHYRDAIEACMNSGRAINWMDWNNVPGNPTAEEIPSHLWGNDTPLQLELLMLTSKTLSGTGLPSGQTWSFAYETLTAGQYELRDVRRKVTVTKPGGHVEESIFGASHLTTMWEEPYPVGTPVQQPNEGLLISHRVLQGGVELRKTENTYQPFPAELASSPSGYDSPYDPWVGQCVCDSTPIRLPLKQQRITQQGSSFTRTVTSFDAYARPVDVSRTSVTGVGTKTRTDRTEYHDNTAHWVVGQVAKTMGAGLQTARTEFNALAQPIKYRGMGDWLVQEVTYHADGSPHTVKDGKGNTTTLSNWHRGIPRNVAFADATTQSALVHDAGWITQVTDQNGFSTGYEYDAVGRLKKINYPTGDAVAWNATQLSFAKLTAAELGFPAGTWRQQVTTGNGYKRTYFDAMWRPRLTHEFDAANVAGTSRYSAWAYDHDGRTTFAAYPLASASSLSSFTLGVDTAYDALGRVTTVVQDSEMGNLTTLTEYLSGFQTRTTNPRGKATTVSFLAWDQPDTSMPLVVDAPAGQRTAIIRDGLGRSTRVTRQGLLPGQTEIQNRRYIFDPEGRLCKLLEPETGATVMAYDAAGNVIWSAGGLPLTVSAETDCTNARSVAYSSGRRVDRTYDSLNRLKTLSFPDGNGNQIWTYTPDGLPDQVTTHNSNNDHTVLNGYVYDRRRNLVSETQAQPGWYAWALGYGYDSNGHLASQRYPSEHTVAFAPNALGQPTQAGSYATGVQYFPNGAMKQFTYGNGILHTLSQNTRQLPHNSSDSHGVHSQDYGYDENGNVIATLDNLDSTRSRWIAYDDLDRLTDAGSVVFGGDHWHRFTYDVLDNLRSWKLAGVKDYASYNYDPATNRLTNITTAGGAVAQGFTYDAQGNVNTRNGASFEFSFGNRLRSFNGQEGYRYDALGRRVLAWRASGGSTLSMYTRGGEVSYLWSEPTQRASDNIYLNGSLVAVRERAFSDDAITLKYQHTDALGSPVATTNQAGTVIDRTSYEPYGKAIGETLDGVGYTGHVMDPVSGLVYMQQRYYDPAIGRFLSSDPMASDMQNGWNFNRYNYAANNPYKFRDPDGRMVRRTLWGENPWDGWLEKQNCERVCLGNADGKPDKSYIDRGRSNKLFWDLGDDFEASLDIFPGKTGAEHEFHVYRNGKEVGLFQNGGFFDKHGKSGVPEGFSAINMRRLSGLDSHMLVSTGRMKVSTSRARGLLHNFKGALRGAGRFLPVVTVGLVMTGQMNPSEAFGISEAGCASTTPCGGYTQPESKGD